MAQVQLDPIDALLQFLVDQRGHELLMTAGENCYIVDAVGTQVLNRVVSASEVAALVQEVLPASLQDTFSRTGSVTFLHRAEAGECRVSTERVAGNLRVTLARTPVSYIEEVARHGMAAGASDVFLSPDGFAFQRREGVLERIADAAVPPDGVLNAFLEECRLPDAGPNARGQFITALGAVGRVRCSRVMGPRGPGLALRLLPQDVSPPGGLPFSFCSLLSGDAGLVAAAALPGHGLTHLLAGLLRMAAAQSKRHIVCVEELPEIPLPTADALIMHCQTGPALPRADAIRTALAMCPDVLVVDVVADVPTLLAVLDAVHDGCLVIAGCRARSVAGAVAWLADRQPAADRGDLLFRLSGALRGAVAQVLCRDVEGALAPARDVLVGTAASAGAVREGRLDNLAEGIRAVGFSLDDALLRLVLEERISAEEALEHALDRRLLREEITFRRRRGDC